MPGKGIIFIILIAFLLGASIPAKADPPITLQQCLKTALKRHPSIRAYQRLLEQKTAESQTLRAETLPKIDYSLMGSVYRYAPYHYRSVENALVLSWNAGKWLGKLREIGITEESIAKIQAKQNRLKLVLNVKQAFYQLVQARQERYITRVSESYLRHHLFVSQQLFHLGQIDQLDLYRTQASLAAAQEAAENAENHCRQWQIRLQNLTSLAISENDSLILPAGDLIVPETSTDTLLSEARRANPDLTLLDQQIHITELQEKLAGASRFPNVALSTGFVFDNDPTSGGNYAVLQGGIQLPLVDWHERKNEAKGFRLHRESLKETQKAILLDIRTNIQQLLAKLHYLKNLQKLKAKTILQAREAYFLTEKSYEAGAATNTDVLLSQKEWIQAKLSQENVRLQLRLANAQLDLLIGRIGVLK